MRPQVCTSFISLLVVSAAFALDADPRPEIEARIEQLKSKAEEIQSSLAEDQKELSDAQSQLDQYKNIASKNAEKARQLEEKAREIRSDSKLDAASKRDLLREIQSKLGSIRNDPADENAASKASLASRLQTQVTQQKQALKELNASINKETGKLSSVRYMCKDGHQHASKAECSHPGGGQWVYTNQD